VLGERANRAAARDARECGVLRRTGANRSSAGSGVVWAPAENNYVVLQDKGEGRMAPKFARLLSDARPSAVANAIQPLGTRLVCGPWPAGWKLGP